VLQCVAVCCSVLQCVAVCCSVLQCVAVCCSVLQCVAVCCTVLHCAAVQRRNTHADDGGQPSAQDSEYKKKKTCKQKNDGYSLFQNKN